MSQGQLSVLITNLILSGRSGTENVVRSLAQALQALGHRPIVYSPQAGPVADELRAASVRVVTELSGALPPVDIIHGHHLPTTVAAMARWPETPAIFVGHDAVAWHDRPPLFPAVRRYVAVDDTVAGRLVSDGVPASRLAVVLNQPDLDRFVPGPPLPDRPRRALAFAKNEGHLGAIRRACEVRGIDLDIAGSAVDRVLDAPERVLPAFDLVFTSALSALEAMACGRGVIVCDGRGLAGWVTPSVYPHWRRMNFGLGILRAPVTVEGVLAEIDRYSPAGAHALEERIRSEGGIRAQACEYLALYSAAIEDETWRDDVDGTRAALAAYIQEWSPSEARPRAWMRERDHLLERAEAGLVAERCTIDTVYGFSEASTETFVRPLAGVWPSEGWGRWTAAPTALLVLRAPFTGAIQIHLRVVPFLAAAHRRQRISCEINGLPLPERTFEGERTADPVPLTLAIPVDRVPDDGLLWIRLGLPDAVSPASLGISDDPRQLGVALVDLRITPA